MNSFAPTEKRLALTVERHPSFPRQPAVLVRLVKHIHKQLHDDANAELKPFGLNHPEYNLLMMLYGTDGGAMSPTALCEAAGEKAANITRLSDRLVEKGLMARCADDDDRRRVALSLTEQGRTIIEQLLPSIDKLLHKQTRHLGATDQAQLERLLKKMLAGLGDA